MTALLIVAGIAGIAPAVWLLLEMTKEEENEGL